MRNPLKETQLGDRLAELKDQTGDRWADLKDRIGDRMPGFIEGMPRWVWYTLIVLFLVAPLLYWKVGGWVFYYRLGNDVTWQAPAEFTPKGGSATVGTLAALMTREVIDNPWTPNDPWFVPSASLDDPQNFQIGVQQAAERIALALSDYIGRDRGSSSFNPDLVAARSGLNYKPTRWVMSSESDTLVTESSESMYGTAIEKLIKYNNDLANPQVNVWYTLRADNLRDTLALISSDLGSAAVFLADHVQNGSGGYFDQKADDVFLQVQGKLYVYYMILQALEKDFGQVIQTKQANTTWSKMMGYMKDAADVDPMIVFNGHEESLMCPNHLANQSARLQMAGRALNEIRDILDR